MSIRTVPPWTVAARNINVAAVVREPYSSNNLFILLEINSL